MANEKKLRLFHHEGGRWVDITTSLDTVNNIICGVVTSLSPFLLAEPGYTFGGILQPIAADGSSVFKRGRVVPVKCGLLDPAGVRGSPPAPSVPPTGGCSAGSRRCG